MASIISQLIDHVLGRRYYCVLMSRPNIRVRDTNGMHPYEMSSDIFFSREEAREYLDRMRRQFPGDTFDTHDIICFRSHEPIPEWNMQREHACNRANNDRSCSLLV